MEIILAISALACLVVLFVYSPRIAIGVICAPFVGFVLIAIWAIMKN